MKKRSEKRERERKIGALVKMSACEEVERNRKSKRYSKEKAVRERIGSTQC